MYNFHCEICKNTHRLITLFEFPQPDIISKISSGALKQTLTVFAKNSFIINRDYLIIGCQLTLDIIDFEDELDMLVWVEVTKKEFQSKIAKDKDVAEIKLKGTLDRHIPFYKNTKNLPVELLIVSHDDALPFISEITIENELQKDFKNGITLAKLQGILMKLYHDQYK